MFGSSCTFIWLWPIVTYWLGWSKRKTNIDITSHVDWWGSCWDGSKMFNIRWSGKTSKSINRSTSSIVGSSIVDVVINTNSSTRGWKVWLSNIANSAIKPTTKLRYFSISSETWSWMPVASLSDLLMPSFCHNHVTWITWSLPLVLC